VAIETPAHRERSCLPHQRHGSDRPMTGRAADSFGNMDGVIEINVIGQPMHALPVDRFVLGQAIAHRRKHRGVGKELRMARHAGRRRRQTGEGGFFNGRVAVTAIDTVVADVMLVTEGYRLMQRDVLASDIRRSHHRVGQAD